MINKSPTCPACGQVMSLLDMLGYEFDLFSLALRGESADVRCSSCRVLYHCRGYSDGSLVGYSSEVCNAC